MGSIFRLDDEMNNEDNLYVKTYDEGLVSKQTSHGVEYLQVIHFVNPYQKAMMLRIPTKGEYNFYEYPKLAQITVYDETNSLIQKEITMGFRNTEDRDKYFSYHRGAIKPEKISYLQLTE